ncbi:protein-disulfide reductase DsbD family protein [Labilibaculum sp. K2S]|uniref:protein-disulfide reductase DsbD domain-containing protein n=1 Tax=Labilibaculum sp. K2S TaxID=3056386 RepID=UPI0025A3CC83|nr:protein-disulfide reductase DsbD domain-containing protein [Labilibaculum sp. K2S]MDM8158466.1 protein-disulfide reductase DsbD family protein [Labilibaculum sp. K2S]
MNRKITLAALLLIVLSSISFGQILTPSKWKVELSKKEFKAGEVIDIVFKATIDKTWHLYSNDFDPELGPILIEFDFEKNASYERIGNVKPINAKKHYDKIWEGEVSYFENTAEMRQQIKIKSLPLKIVGTFEYQTCSDKSGQCVMGDDEFDITYPAN